MSRYPWAEISPYLNFATTDESGARWAWATPPVRHKGAWVRSIGSRDLPAPEPIGYREPFSECPDWRDSLEPRPTLIAEAPESPAREGVTEAALDAACYAFDKFHQDNADYTPAYAVQGMRAALEAFLNARNQT